MLRKFVYARPQVLVSVITKTKTPSDQYQSPMCLECDRDSSVNTVAKTSNEFASVDLLTNEKRTTFRKSFASVKNIIE